MNKVCRLAGARETSGGRAAAPRGGPKFSRRGETGVGQILSDAGLLIGWSDESDDTPP
jgi:hypothetical protein